MKRLLAWLGIVTCVLVLAGAALEAAKGAGGNGHVAAPTPTAHATQPASRPAMGTATNTGRTNFGPDVVVLKELVDAYEPVPFAHKRHAEMAEMWDGCVTCHHHTPKTRAAATQAAAHSTTHPTTHPATQAAAHAATTHPATALAATTNGHAAATTNGHAAVTGNGHAAVTGNGHAQGEADVIPACKSCHAVNGKDADVRMPSLKGAYHRQCLDCHRDWMDANACNACHAPRAARAIATTRAAPAPDDITGRMHKPIAAPVEKVYRVRFTPVAGPNVTFRHDEHAKTLGVKCVTCHRHDACSSCHAGNAGPVPRAEASRTRPLKSGGTWREAHGPCVSCHEQDACATCHYKDGQKPPPPFDHARTGQTFDKDHDKLKCAACHTGVKTAPPPTCGDASCHKTTIAFPAKRPGPYTAPVKHVLAAQPGTQSATPAATRAGPATTPAATATSAPASAGPASTQPTTRPTIIKIRRGGL